MAGKKRQISDDEIGLIKAMLAAGMPNDEVHYYFNRLDRLLSPGRISQIRNGKYGAAVPVATSAAVDSFFLEWKRRDHLPSAVVADPETPISEKVVAALFERRRDGWYVRDHETDTVECKESFSIRSEERFAKILRAIAGLANNRGGYVILGIKDNGPQQLKVVGLPTTEFATTDPAAINRILVSALSPVPRFRLTSKTIDGMSVGIIYVEEDDNPPVMANKNLSDVIREGAIYFRYVGETRPIKPAELREILAFRERKAVERLSQSVSRIATGNAVALDLDTGLAAGPGGRLVVDKQLLDGMQFIREGEFSETVGGPTLRVIGEVTPIDRSMPPAVQVLRTPLTSGDILKCFLENERVPDATPYLMHACYAPRKWLPIWFFLSQTTLDAAAAITLLQEQNATQIKNRDFIVRRLKQTITAYKPATGKTDQICKALQKGIVEPPRDSQSDKTFLNAVQALKKAKEIDVHALRSALLGCLSRAGGSASDDKARLGLLYRAACRLDELLFAPEGVSSTAVSAAASSSADMSLITGPSSEDW